jgi:hypothetical protein
MEIAQKENKEKHFREMNYHGFCMCKKPMYSSQQKAYLSTTDIPSVPSIIGLLLTSKDVISDSEIITLLLQERLGLNLKKNLKQ